MTVSRVEIYKSEEGEQCMAQWYQRTLDSITRPVEFINVETRFGQTNVMVVGPKDAPPLLCLHGVMSAGPHAFTQVESMASDFRMYFPDIVGQPGRSAQTQPAMRGEPYGQWCLDVMDGLGFESMAALGASMGGFVLVRAATIAPERFTRLVLWTPGGLVNGKAWDGFKLSMSLMWYFAFESKRALDIMLSTVSSDMTDHWRQFYADSFKYVKIDARMPQIVKPHELDKFTAPVMLIAHEHDPLFPAQPLQKKAKSVFKNLALVEVIPELKHVPPFDAEARQPILDKITAFLHL